MSAPESLHPARFSYDNDKLALVIEWSDGVTQSIPFTALRRSCPCAICSGELGRPGRFVTKPELDPGEDELADIALVGLYGLTAVWSDGHNTGIYTFANLRNLGTKESSS